MQQQRYVVNYYTIYCQKIVLVATNPTVTKTIWVAIWTMPMNYFAWQYDLWKSTTLCANMISGNEIYYEVNGTIATVWLAWQIVPLASKWWCGNKGYYHNVAHGKCLYRHATDCCITTSCNRSRRVNCLYHQDREQCYNFLLPSLATNSSDCNKDQLLQWQTTIAMTNKKWLQNLIAIFGNKHGCDMYFWQPNWALQCFLIVEQGSKTSITHDIQGRW